METRRRVIPAGGRSLARSAALAGITWTSPGPFRAERWRQSAGRLAAATRTPPPRARRARGRGGRSAAWPLQPVYDGFTRMGPKPHVGVGARAAPPPRRRPATQRNGLPPHLHVLAPLPRPRPCRSTSPGARPQRDPARPKRIKNSAPVPTAGDGDFEHNSHLEVPVVTPCPAKHVLTHHFRAERPPEARTLARHRPLSMIVRSWYSTP